MSASSTQTSDTRDEPSPWLSLDFFTLEFDNWSDGLSIDLLQLAYTEQAYLKSATEYGPAVLQSENRLLDFDFSMGNVWTSEVTNRIASFEKIEQNSVEAYPNLNGQHHDLLVLGNQRAQYVHKACFDLQWHIEGLRELIAEHKFTRKSFIKACYSYDHKAFNGVIAMGHTYNIMFETLICLLASTWRLNEFKAMWRFYPTISH
jgi:hypothetical protein